MASLDQYRRNDYSQFGEDGVIEEILRRLDITDGWFCEFGAWDGQFLSNCRRLLDLGWHGVMIEGNPQRHKDLLVLQEKFPEQLTGLCRMVSHTDPNDYLDVILRETEIPPLIDVLSIDIDGADLSVFQTITKYRARVLSIEVQSVYPPGVWIMSEGEPWSGARLEGSSFTATIAVLRLAGYEPVAHTGNLIAVRSEDIDAIGLTEAERAEPAFLFNWDWAQYLLPGEPPIGP